MENAHLFICQKILWKNDQEPDTVVKLTHRGNCVGNKGEIIFTYTFWKLEICTINILHKHIYWSSTEILWLGLQLHCIFFPKHFSSSFSNLHLSSTKASHLTSSNVSFTQENWPIHKTTGTWNSSLLPPPANGGRFLLTHCILINSIL